MNDGSIMSFASGINIDYNSSLHSIAELNGRPNYVKNVVKINDER